MTTEREDSTLRRYREANAALDEAPSAATRAAILAAAARAVDAQPRPVGAYAPSRRRRWPLAVAATVLLSTLAVMLATRTEEEMPRFAGPAEPGIASAPPPASRDAPMALSAPDAASRDAMAAPGSTASPAASAAPPVPAARADAAASRRAAAPSPSAERAHSAEPPRAGSGASPAAPPGETAAPPRQTAGPSPQAAAPPPPSSPAANAAAERERAAESPARMEARREQHAASAESRARAPAAPVAVPSPPLAQAVPRPDAAAGTGMPAEAHDAAPAAKPLARAARSDTSVSATPEPRTAEEWLDRIVRLRVEGLHDAADAELKRFRERYPEVQVPRNALPPRDAAPGTR